MRQVGSLTNHDDAQRFLAYLVTQRVDAQLEQEGERWVVWVHDEDKVPLAKSSLAEFVSNPNLPKYQDAKRQAESVLREEQNKRRLAQKNVVEMRGRWGSGGTTARKAPLMIALAGLAVVTSLLTGTLFSQNQKSGMDAAPLAALKFADSRPSLITSEPAAPAEAAAQSPFRDILRGQIWRLVTPIFLHFGPFHLVFNLYWFWQFAGQIEDIRGATKLAILVLVIGVLSNIGQAVAVSPNFGGLSGVVYGLLGYLWMRIRQGNREGYQLTTSALVISLVWFLLCIARQDRNLGPMLSAMPDNVANVAHGVGLVVGIGLGLMPDDVKGEK